MNLNYIHPQNGKAMIEENSVIYDVKGIVPDEIDALRL